MFKHILPKQCITCGIWNAYTEGDTTFDECKLWLTLTTLVDLFIAYRLKDWTR